MPLNIKDLRPKIFDADPQSSEARKQWTHWYKSFTCYIAKYEDISEADKLNLLINHVNAAVYEIISDAASYNDAITQLERVYAATPNSIFARYLLRSCKQQPGQSVDEFFQKLKQLCVDCNFTAVTAQVHKQQAIRDAFISGLASSEIRQRLLEEPELAMQAAFDKARSLEIAHDNAEQYKVDMAPSIQPSSIAAVPAKDAAESITEEFAVATVVAKCFFCGNKKHPRKNCPARDTECYRCKKRGHFAKVCRSNSYPVSSSTQKDTCASLMKLTPQDNCSNDGVQNGHDKVNVSVKVNGVFANALIDTGSRLSHISDCFSERLNLVLQNSNHSIGLAIKGCASSSLGVSKVKVELNGRSYSQVPVTILKDLLTDVVLGQDFLEQHKSINIQFGGTKPALHLGALEPIKTSTPVKLFEHLKENCTPIATKERRYSTHDKKFISAEIRRLLSEDLIEKSNSPWRAQPFVITPENHRKRLVIDYSQTINKFTQLDAYPLPLTQDVVNNVAQYKIYSTLDMSSAYHQVELPTSDRMYTAFQADGSLWQWKRIPFGLSNAVPAFQRIVDDIIKQNDCKGTFAYLDNITVGGKTQREHDENLAKFLKVARECNLTFNDSKCVYSTDCVKLLGYQITEGC